MSLKAPTCPLCGNTEFSSPWHRFTAAQAAAHFCPPRRDRDRHQRLYRSVARLWDGEEGAAYICPKCDFGFAHPFAGGDAEFYGILHEQAGYPQWRWEYGVVTREVLASKEAGGRILDVGTGDGSFLRPLESRWECYASESTPAAQDRLRSIGINVFPDLATGVRRAAGTFQVVTMFQVLEHIAAFKSVLADCRRLLVTGGTLAVSVPDRSATLVQEEVTGCFDMPPNHVNKWSGPSLARAMAEAGFRPGPPRIEPASWRHVGYGMQLRLMAAATRPGTLAAKVYQVRHKPTRVALLAMAGALTALGSLPSLPRLKRGSAMLMIAEAV